MNRVALRVAAGASLLFLWFPLAIVILYTFTTDDLLFTFPPPGLTTRWFDVAFHNDDIWTALWLSVRVAAASTVIALVLGTMASAAVARSNFFGREAVSFLVVLPIALPGIITGIALRSAITLGDIDLSSRTIIVGHATFCVVVVYNNVLARLRRTSGSIIEASMDLGASGLQTLRYVLLPSVGSALLAGGILAFALSFDEIIVTTFTRGGSDKTLPIWIFDSLNRPRNRPVLNVVALIVMAVTLVPIAIAQRIAGGSAVGGRG